MLEPKDNSNSRLLTDPPGIVRHIVRRLVDPVVNPAKLQATRDKLEAARSKAGAPHIVEYFHQLDDPYSHLTAQILGTFAERYEIEVVPHLIRASGGKNQPEEARLARWARRDAELIAPYMALEFPTSAPVRPSEEALRAGLRALGGLSVEPFINALPEVSKAVWAGEPPKGASANEDANVDERLDAGNARLAKLGHYSGATFFYGGEWYWGVDRLFHLERRLRELGACRNPDLPLICPRPPIEVSGVDASDLELDFYPSLNSPYTAIVYDKTISLAKACRVNFNHKPVLPMIMRGVPVTRAKTMYIFYDAAREAQDLGVPFGPVMVPVGKPVRDVYALLPWAKEKGCETRLLSQALHLAFGKGVGLHRRAGLRAAVERAGLSWTEAQANLGNEDWKPAVAASQSEMLDDLGLWGVPSYRLQGGGAEDLCVWGQDRLWLVAAEIKKRAENNG